MMKTVIQKNCKKVQ